VPAAGAQAILEQSWISGRACSLRGPCPSDGQPAGGAADVPQGQGLIVSTTANVGALPYMPNLFYDLAKHAVARLAWAMAQELRAHGIAAVAVAPASCGPNGSSRRSAAPAR